MRPDGHLVIALDLGERRFEEVGQALPAVTVAEVLPGDLDGDGRLDLYLVSPGTDVALLGAGRGVLLVETETLGLVDHGEGLLRPRGPRRALRDAIPRGLPPDPRRERHPEPHFTPNEGTAAAQGWTLREADWREGSAGAPGAVEAPPAAER